MKRTYLLFFTLVCVLAQPTFSQTTMRRFTLLDGSSVEASSFSVLADPCKTESREFAVPIEDGGLNRSYVVDPWPPGIEIQTINALGNSKVTNVSRSSNELKFTLVATGDGTLIQQPSAAQTCVGGANAFIEVSVNTHYVSRSLPPPSTYRSPTPDVRLALDFNLLKRTAAGFNYYKVGGWIQLGEAPWYCGDRSGFDVHISEPPAVATVGYLNPDGTYGTTLNLSAAAKAQIQCGGIGNPIVDARANVSASAGHFGGGSVSATGNVNISFGGVFNRNVPLKFDIPVPSISSIPIDLPPVEGTTLEFGTFVNNTFTPSATPTHKDVPITINLGSFGGAANDNGVFIVDATIGQAQSAALSTPDDARAFYTSDQPLWDQRNLGITVRDSFFGAAGNGKSPSGLLGALLPIRVTGDSVGAFHKHFEIVFDGAEVSFIKHNGGDAISVQLSSTYAKIGNGAPLVGNGKPLSKIQASIVLDRIVSSNGVLSFRVADFRIKISSLCFIFPIVLSSGQLQNSLNNGQIPLTGNVNFEIDLPICYDTGFGKFLSPPNTCNPYPLYGHLGYLSGPRTAIYTIDPSTIISRFNQFQVGGQKWQGLQAAVVLKLTQ